MWHIVAIVCGTPLIMAIFALITKGVTKLIPEGRFKQFMTQQRGYMARPDLDSLRRGFK